MIIMMALRVRVLGTIKPNEITHTHTFTHSPEEEKQNSSSTADADDVHYIHIYIPLLSLCATEYTNTAGKSSAIWSGPNGKPAVKRAADETTTTELNKYQMLA